MREEAKRRGRTVRGERERREGGGKRGGEERVEERGKEKKVGGRGGGERERTWRRRRREGKRKCCAHRNLARVRDYYHCKQQGLLKDREENSAATNAHPIQAALTFSKPARAFSKGA